jgi:hypothetical protein
MTAITSNHGNSQVIGQEPAWGASNRADLRRGLVPEKRYRRQSCCRKLHNVYVCAWWLVIEGGLFFMTKIGERDSSQKIKLKYLICMCECECWLAGD